MKFLIDAQLPRRLAVRLTERGHDASHTLDCPNSNRTTDAEICAIAARQERIVVTKDDDFVRSFVLHRQPPLLLLISTGNIGNTELLALIDDNLGIVRK